MSTDPAAIALQRLHVAQANYRLACDAKTTTRTLLDEAVRQGAEAGLSNAEIGRAIGTTGQRISQILSED